MSNDLRYDLSFKPGTVLEGMYPYLEGIFVVVKSIREPILDEDVGYVCVRLSVDSTDSLASYADLGATRIIYNYDIRYALSKGWLRVTL